MQNREKQRIIALLVFCLSMCSLVLSAGCGGKGTAVRLYIKGENMERLIEAQKINGEVLVPVTELAKALDSEVVSDESAGKITITMAPEKSGNNGELYLQGWQESAAQPPDIKRNLISAGDLLKVVDDDNDKDLCDYRVGHSGGDEMDDDPLILDVRTNEEYAAEHIPGAVWIARASDMGRPEHLEELRKSLAGHVERGGKREVVIYCYSGHQSSLVAGVLAGREIYAKSLLFGFDYAWSGLKKFPAALSKAPLEGQSGHCENSGPAGAG